MKRGKFTITQQTEDAYLLQNSAGKTLWLPAKLAKKDASVEVWDIDAAFIKEHKDFFEGGLET